MKSKNELCAESTGSKCNLIRRGENQDMTSVKKKERGIKIPPVPRRQSHKKTVPKTARDEEKMAKKVGNVKGSSSLLKYPFPSQLKTVHDKLFLKGNRQRRTR